MTDAMGKLWRAHACSVPVEAFCRDKLLVARANRERIRFREISRIRDEFANTLQACTPQSPPGAARPFHIIRHCRRHAS